MSHPRGLKQAVRVPMDFRCIFGLIHLDPGESTSGVGQRRAPIGMITDSCHFRTPADIDLPHPDLVALLAMTIIHPWLRKNLTFDRAISPRLAEVLAESFGIDGGPVDRSLAGREAGSQIGLCYSGGADSVAVGELLPAGCVGGHGALDRGRRDSGYAQRSDAV